MAYKGNEKRRRELAKRSGTKEILFVGTHPDPNERLKLVFVELPSGPPSERVFWYLQRLPPEYKAMLGSSTPEDRAR
jgi:hypothetical protein